MLLFLYRPEFIQLYEYNGAAYLGESVPEESDAVFMQFWRNLLTALYVSIIITVITDINKVTVNMQREEDSYDK